LVLLMPMPMLPKTTTMMMMKKMATTSGETQPFGASFVKQKKSQATMRGPFEILLRMMK